MSVVPLNRPYRTPPPAGEPAAAYLLRQGVIDGSVVLNALVARGRTGGTLASHLGQRDAPVFDALARHRGVVSEDPLCTPADPGLIDRLGAAECLRLGLLPWRHAGEATVILATAPEAFLRHRPRLEAAFGPVVMALAPPARIEAAILSQRGAALARVAEATVPDALSCRAWVSPGRPLLVLALCGVLAVGLMMPRLVLGALLVWAAVTLALSSLMKVAAALVTLRRRPAEPPPPAIARLPVVSVMVALYREDRIAQRLLRRLERLDYPRDLLDILLVVEEADQVTRAALSRTELPPWMRIVTVPRGAVTTKPRALNHALGQCRGSIIGVYDAEDAPEADQIRKVVARFHARGATVACLQGRLDFYNPGTNWMARAFTIEYAAWFRVILPGLQRLGLPLPLGGTTLFFRRAALERLGAWDAWNVTEDADLGIRLARAGLRTEVIETTTLEEANCRALPWVRQRSRWIKGYMMTWIVHMREPARLWRDLGPRGFCGMQVLFVCSVSQALLAPLLWSLWLVAAGVGHPALSALPSGSFAAMTALFMAAEVANLLVGWIGLSRRATRLNPVWLLAMPFYFPLAALAAYKAAYEVLTRPFYWDKTAHGLHDDDDG
jgi:cellulose synthase/poly-beta-1,6-N-acetylglucosamine synthase-like glycosyltransferase